MGSAKVLRVSRRFGPYCNGHHGGFFFYFYSYFYFPFFPLGNHSNEGQIPRTKDGKHELCTPEAWATQMIMDKCAFQSFLMYERAIPHSKSPKQHFYDAWNNEGFPTSNGRDYLVSHDSSLQASCTLLSTPLQFTSCNLEKQQTNGSICCLITC
jgi:hypothetical protein